MTVEPGDAAGHARRMDRTYAAQRHVYDLTRKYFLFGRDRLIRELAPPAGAAILEIGCGTGRNLIHIARAYPGTDLFGLDISEEMLKTARATIRRAGLADRITLAQAVAAGFDGGAVFGRARFDRVVMSYTLSMIPPWQAAIGQGLAHLAPGGRLMAVDFGPGQGLPLWFRRGLRAWLAKFHVAPRDDLATVLAEQARDRGLEAAPAQPILGGYAVLGAVAAPEAAPA